MQQLGSGSYGRVYKFTTKYNKQHALKSFELKKLKKGLNDVKEVDISLRLRHPYVIQIIDYTANYVIDDKTSKYTIIYPLATGTLDYLKKKNLSNEQFIKYFFQLILGLNYVHNRGIILVDIKPDNILYFEKEDALKFTDFGLSVYDDKTFRELIYGTLVYAAPELIFKRKEIYKASDIWSLGITFLEMLVGWSPQEITFNQYRNQNFKSMDDAITYYNTKLQEEIKNAFSQINDEKIITMLSRMLTFDYNERATTDELINLPVFHEMKKNLSFIEKSYIGCPIMLLYLNTYDLRNYNDIYDTLIFAFNNCRNNDEYWSWFNAVDIINYLLTINFLNNGEKYITIASFLLSLKLCAQYYYELDNIIQFISPDFNIDYKILEETEINIFNILYGKIYRKNIFSYMTDLNIDFDKKSLSKYVLSTVFEGEIPDYVYKYLTRTEGIINNPYVNVFDF